MKRNSSNWIKNGAHERLKAYDLALMILRAKRVGVAKYRLNIARLVESREPIVISCLGKPRLCAVPYELMTRIIGSLPDFLVEIPMLKQSAQTEKGK